jgi:magnesium dechelatase
MSHLDPAKLHTTFLEGVRPDGPAIPRAYTLTHSDSTGHLFLFIGPDYNRPQISGWYTRLMRDEVLAEWHLEDRLALHVHCHVSGGLVLGTANWRDGIFRRHLPMVLEAFHLGDSAILRAKTSMQNAPIMVHFHAPRSSYDRFEAWGRMSDYEPAVPLDSVPAKVS